MENPLVSIIIPAYNCADYLETTIRSVQNQLYTSWELIIIDDGSIDNTIQVIEKLIESDSRIRLIKQANGRQGKARNTGIKDAKAEWIAFLDSDDIWFPEKLKIQLEETIKDNYDLSFTDGFICLSNQMELREFQFGVEKRVYKGNEAVQEFHKQNKIPTSSVLVKKQVLLDYGMFPEDLEIQNCEDYLLWTKLLDKGCTFIGIPKALFLYRVHSGSSTWQELKLVVPLLKAILILPGKHLTNRRSQLHQVYLRYLTIMIKEHNLRNAPRSLMFQILREIHPGLRSVILSLSWIISEKLFISLLLRSRKKLGQINEDLPQYLNQTNATQT
jgi:teichuronic acid biosynthesis glycosyltransferase TuaG